MAVNPFVYLQKLVSDALGYGIGGSITAVINPQVQHLVNRAWALAETMPLQAIEAAQLVASGERDLGWGTTEAQQTGINSSRFAALVDMVDTAPDLGTLLEMLRRGSIGIGDFNEGAKKGNIEDKWLADLALLKRTPLSAAEAAAARQQGYIEQGEQYEYARLAGVEPADAEIQFESAGLPPGPEAALMMLRRGIITPAEFTQMIREGNTKVKYTDEFLELQDVPLSLASAVEGVVKERMTATEGHNAAAKWGIDAATFDQLVDNAGRPIGGQQAVTLFNRGYYDRADVEQVVARSNVKTQYTDAIIELGKRYPTLFQMKQLVQGKAIDPATAAKWLKNNGYQADVSGPLIEAWSQATTAHEKDLAKSEILALYEGRIITQANTQTMLGKLGYDAQEITFLTELADSRRSRRFLDSALTRIHNLYVTRQIDAATASRDMSALDLSTGAIDDLMAIWLDERNSVVLTLTPAQVLRALKLDLVSGQYAYTFLTQRGYADTDARILISIVKGIGPSGMGQLPAPIG